MRGKKIVVLTGCLAVSVLFSSCYLLPQEEEAVEVPKLIESQEELYTTCEVERGDVESILICSINIEARETIAESFTEGGKIAAIYFMKGEKVEEGQLLAELEGIDYREQIAQQELTIKARAIDIEEAKARLAGKSEKELKALKREIELLNDEIASLQKTYQLDQELLKEGGISQNEVDELETKIKNKQQELTDKQEEIDHPDQSDEVTKRLDVERAQIAYDSAVLTKKELEEKLSRMKLYASCSGTITYLTSKQPGEIVGKEDKIFQIAKAGEKQVTYQGNDTDKFHVGDRVMIEADTETYDAEVIETPASVPFAVRNKASYTPTVYFRFLDPDASAQFTTMPNILKLTKVLDSRKNVLRIPTSSIAYVDGKSYVNVLENDVRIQKTIKTGLSTDAYTEVISGLTEGEQIILK